MDRAGKAPMRLVNILRTSKKYTSCLTVALPAGQAICLQAEHDPNAKDFP